MAHIEATARIDTNILNRYLRVVCEPIKRKSVVYQELDRRNRISFNNFGKTCEWRARYKRRTITAGLGTAVAISFPQTPIRKVLSLPWRHYQLGESISYYETLLSKNRETALFPIVEEVTGTCAEDFLESFRLKLYGDGNAGTGRELHGFDSFTANIGALSGSKVADPSDTYAGISTALNQGGDWSGTWPVGTGDTEYCWSSPFLCDVNNSGFTGYASGVGSTWQQAIRYVTTFGSALQQQEYDLLVICSDWYNVIRDSLESDQRFNVTATSGSGTTDVGFKTLDFEGLKIAHEYGCPDNAGYFWNFDKVELRCLTGQLVEMMQDTDITAGGQKLYAFQFYGNMMFQAPSFFAKLVEATALGT